MASDFDFEIIFGEKERMEAEVMQGFEQAGDIQDIEDIQDIPNIFNLPSAPEEKTITFTTA
jgi:hypothetical protein